jgi:hypothetical protein
MTNMLKSNGMYIANKCYRANWKINPIRTSSKQANKNKIIINTSKLTTNVIKASGICIHTGFTEGSRYRITATIITSQTSARPSTLNAKTGWDKLESDSSELESGWGKLASGWVELTDTASEKIGPGCAMSSAVVILSRLSERSHKLSWVSNDCNRKWN